MAPTKESTSVPLADYFFISGIESTQIYDEREHAAASPPPVDETIEEDIALETDSVTSPRPSTPGSPNTDRTKRGSSRYSWEARKSISSVISPGEFKPTPSNRSSATIKGLQSETPGLSDEDFEIALRKFASERENFLEEIQVQAGAVVPQTSRTPKPRPRTVRITSSEDAANNAAAQKGGIGGLRRRLSTMNSMKRQPSVSLSRQREYLGASTSQSADLVSLASTRTSKRLSGYNSVIPTPKPFKASPDMHPLKRRYEPVLLDRYPPKAQDDEMKRRCPFPDYVPMFAFPNDVVVVSSDERPRSTWHGFAMTTGDGSKLHAICVTVWMPLNESASVELERQCEAWRKANMSDEERELASSLGERLAGERAKLSRLLAELPNAAQGSAERDTLDEQISAVEEKISLMADLLRPVRHGAASKIEGLTDGESGFWIPRCYGVLGKDGAMTSFWKEWLKAIVTPMTNGAVLRVPPSSPRIGMWQPLERYVVNLCVEAPSPMSSSTQIEVAIRELRLYARKEAENEIPGSRNTDIYALFRALSMNNIITLFEYVLSESRIILLSSHTSMLHLASAAITSLLYPLKWAGVFIPVLPARLIQALEAPCPYIVGVERRYENLEFPDDDFVLVDLDQDIIESTARPTLLPRQQRRKLIASLQVVAPHHTRYGVPVGPPSYAIETFPNDAFSSENPQIYSQRAVPSSLASLVGANSAAFSEIPVPTQSRNVVLNAFLNFRTISRGSDRPSTSSTTREDRRSSSTRSPPSPTIPSPLSQTFPTTPVSRNDSGYSMQTSLREKRSAHFDVTSRRNSSFGFDRMANLRRPSAANGSQPFISHNSSMSTSTLANSAGYAPSVYAPSTLAASTIMPNAVQPSCPRDTETTKWVEGHCLVWRPREDKMYCSICDEKCEDGVYRCGGCNTNVHPRCLHQISVVCPLAFRPEAVRAVFVRCFASLLYTYRRFMHPASGERRKAGMVYHFNMDQFIRSVPGEATEYITMMRETQMFNEFIHERESTRAENPSIKLFDEIILAKRNRGRGSIFSKHNTSWLFDTSEHLWRSASTAAPNSRFPGDYRQVVSRIPAKLDTTLMKEPRAVQGLPRPQTRTKRKPIPSMMGISVDEETTA
ncbi:DENN-domain-containing protein [Aureobasidium sp. EXF-3400]|nr:DENN-domain-containing protein [Aureobasidium sp. EXF-12344]KAI4777126.1 DENN-domain-containing protein [Aureobasidium sp. EXF-3400]